MSTAPVLDISKKKKKPPACDACKARRVLCHSQPNGIPCPRCAEKGIICRTTSLPRGRPRKNRVPGLLLMEDELAEAPKKASPTSGSQSHNGSTNGDWTSPESEPSPPGPSPPLHQTIAAAPVTIALTCDLVKHLWECFTETVCSRHPIFQHLKFAHTLSSVSWNLDLLPPEAQTLAICICAVGSTLSFHPSIIGYGSTSSMDSVFNQPPRSLTDRTVFYLGADLRQYGKCRGPIRRALFERAVNAACHCRIQLSVSAYNLASCFLLDALDECERFLSGLDSGFDDTRFQRGQRSGSGNVPIYPNRAIGQVRSKQCLIWNTRRGGASCLGKLSSRWRKDGTFQCTSHIDQLAVLKIDVEPPSLESLLDQVRSTHAQKRLTSSVYAVMQSYMYHTIRSCRSFNETITGDHARRNPLSDSAASAVLSSLATVKSLFTLMFDDVVFPEEHRCGIDWTPTTIRTNPVTCRTVRSCAITMYVGYLHIILALYREVEYRLRVHISGDVWARKRLALLREQVRELVIESLPLVEKTIRLISFKYGCDVLFSSIVRQMADFCISEWTSIQEAPGTTSWSAMFRRLADTLKLLGYANDDPQANAVIDSLESQLKIFATPNALHTNSMELLLDSPGSADASVVDYSLQMLCNGHGGSSDSWSDLAIGVDVYSTGRGRPGPY
ncbi:unnamed protein product [Mycena citricolor]|uniref:Zn(2)-C6 fungal-type domain-containing protein n=1 Tax=Mycena citricolor TaxID=2018698 RepID=A0AAD2GXP7_9AGAR|nr:unnamed protein product [Mycena citricolor]